MLRELIGDNLAELLPAKSAPASPGAHRISGKLRSSEALATPTDEEAPIFSWLAKKMIARNMAKASEGNIGPTLRMDAEDVRFRFPGNSSWAGEIVGKAELERWLRRFADTGLQISPDEVVLKGFPWKQTICIRGTDQLDTPEGERVYENRYVIWGHLRWGKLREYEVYEDTEKSRALDEYLAAQGDPLSRRAIGGGS